jgi:drug/metabolite transporter (DMT)-like permease
MFYAAYLLSTQRARSTTDTVTFMVISVLTSAAVLLALNLLLKQPLTGFPPQSWAALLGLALISHVGGWLSINYSLGHLPATRVSVSLLGQPLVTTLVAIPLLGEIPTARQALGAALVLAGIYTVLRSRER